MARLNPQGLAEVRRRLSGVALAAAQEAAQELQDKLSGAGSGEHWPGLPRRSSAPGEFPAQQTGELRASIAAREAGEMRAEFGPIHDPPPYALALHFRPPSQGGRPFLDLALQDSDVQAAAAQGALREAEWHFGTVQLRRRA